MQQPSQPAPQLAIAPPAYQQGMTAHQQGVLVMQQLEQQYQAVRSADSCNPRHALHDLQIRSCIVLIRLHLERNQSCV